VTDAEPPRVPRLRAYLNHVEGTTVLTMRRSAWDALSPRLGERVEIEVENLPISQVARDATVVAVNAVRLTSTGVDVEVYRDDPKDAPCRINLDRYAVVEHLAAHVDLPQIIRLASTEDNPNLRTYLYEKVFLVKKRPGPDHHLMNLPAHVIVRSTST
jgi:hypothetical protein